MLDVKYRTLQSKPAPLPVSGTESDSDSVFSPDYSPSVNANSYFIAAPASHPLVSNASAKHLSAIAEGRTGSGGEETDEEDEDDDECHPDANQSLNANMRLKRQTQHGDSMIKSGYLWKKGERRKVRVYEPLSVFKHTHTFHKDMEEALVRPQTCSTRILQIVCRVPAPTTARCE